MCGVIGLLLASVDQNAAIDICEGLNLLQHRGQDACGIVTCGPKGRFYQCKSNGMVRDVLDPISLATLIGSMGVGHVRYPTAGSTAQAEAQPFYVNSPYGIVLAHNGNLINTSHLRYYLDHYAHRHINTDSDSELLLNILADNLQKTGKFRIDHDDIFRAISGLMKHCHGAYACVAMLAGFGIIAFRDPNGIRPLGYARRKSHSSNNSESQSWDYMISSESVTCDANGFLDWVDIQPGQAIIITRSGVKTRQTTLPHSFTPDIFEFVYFARPDSVIDGISVYRSRMAMGDALAVEAKRILNQSNLSIDVIIPVPDTSRVAALQCAQALNIPYREGFVKNRYVGRTFIMPGQQTRQKNVRRKLNAMAMEFEGKSVMLVDDSIVRGTTSKEIIQMARDAGAKTVIMASCAPPIRYPNVFGIDMPSRKELVAHNRTEDEIAIAIGADKVVFQTLDQLIQSCSKFSPSITQFDCSVFNGEYITGGVDEDYLQKLENSRGSSKIRKDLQNSSNLHSTSSSTQPNQLIDGQSSLGPTTSKTQTVLCSSNPINSTSTIPPAEAIGLTNETQSQVSSNDMCIGLANSGNHPVGAKSSKGSRRTSISLEEVQEQIRLDRDQTEDLEKSMKDSLRIDGGHKDGTVGGMVHDDGGHDGYIPSTPNP